MWRLVMLLSGVALAGPAAEPARTGEPARMGEPVRVVEADGLAVDAQRAGGGRLCLDVTAGGREHRDATCPVPSRSARGDLAPRLLPRDERTVVYGATTRHTRALELILGDGTRTVVDTVPAAGFPDLRFYAAATEGSPTVAAGTARGAGGEARAARDFDVLELPPLGERARLARLRDEAGAAATFVATAARVLYPTAARPDHRRSALCVGLRRDGAPSRSVCVDDPDKMDLRFAADCSTHRLVLYGIGPPQVRSATAVLDGGAGRPVEVERIPRRVGRAGTSLLLAAAGGYPRSVATYDARGRHLATAALSGGRC